MQRRIVGASVIIPPTSQSLSKLPPLQPFDQGDGELDDSGTYSPSRMYLCICLKVLPH